MRPDDFVETFLVAATEAAWKLRRRDRAVALELPPEVMAGYGSLPSDYGVFLRAVAQAVSADDAVWLLCEGDFRRDAAGFAWDEIERTSLDGADSEGERRRIAAFWDSHLPVAMAPNGDYDYLAISIRDGAVVHGCAPEWEETTRVADSFADWLRLLSSALLDASADVPFAVRLMARRHR